MGVAYLQPFKSMVTKKPKIAKRAAPTHVVIPDTNILWHADKSLVVDPDFDKFWDTHKLTLPMELAVPEVVVGELNFQQTTSAIKLLTKVNESLKDLSGIVDRKHSTKLTAPEVRSQVAAKINRWLKTKAAIELKTPIDEIKWAPLVQSAIWRTPPFSFDPKNPDFEKGFRDALILETLIAASNHALTEGKNVAFLCKDQLLRTTAVEALKAKKNVLCFESLRDFEGYIKLTREELTSSFVTAIQNRARQRFFTPSDKTSFYATKNVRKLIDDRFPKELQPPFNSNTLRGGLLSLSEAKWEQIAGQRWIGSATFEKLIQPRRYCWTTKVTVARLFHEISSIGGESSRDLQSRYLLIVAVNVKWSADVKADGRFLDADIDNIELGERTFDVATPELMEKWGLSNGLPEK